MLTQTKGKIFLAGQRHHFENAGVRSLHTFAMESPNTAHQAPFGVLYVWNDDTLAGGRSLVQFVEELSDVILLPTVGTVRYTDSTGHDTFVAAGQVQQHTLQKGTTFEVSNPYENELINFIQIWIRRTNTPTFSKPHVLSFNMAQAQNRLIQMLPNAPMVYAGKFTGREETTYTLSNLQNGVFVFVLQGAFEVQNRLLETRDGLALWSTPAVEIEALSNEALLLVIEVPLR